jgi:SAM-dependent methyltransferase
MNEEQEPPRSTPSAPPPTVRRIGKSINAIVARYPVLWPILRRPVRRFFDRLAGGWDARVEPDSPRHLAALVAALERLESAPGRALDIGTGTGSAALEIARRYPDATVFGVDISPLMIDAARAKLPADLAGRVEFSVADAGSLPFESDSFDLVAQISVPVFFDEIARVLRPGGYSVVVSSLGEATPFHTPENLLRSGFERRGLQWAASGSGGPGTFYVARLPA